MRLELFGYVLGLIAVVFMTLLFSILASVLICCASWLSFWFVLMLIM